MANKKGANKKESNSPASVSKNSNDESGGTAGTSNSAGLKSFEHIIESLIQTQNQCRDEQAQHFAQLEVSA